MLSDLFRAVPALGRGRVDVAFIDLANFGKWNSDHGQARGDDLLVLLTRELRAVPRSRTHRDGGDEFLVVGSPGTHELAAGLSDLCRRWPAIQREHLPGLPVVPLRIVIGSEPANGLREAREHQGVLIGVAKGEHKEPPEEGVIVPYGG
jgi:GGDEF domain-containing protein